MTDTQGDELDKILFSLEWAITFEEMDTDKRKKFKAAIEQYAADKAREARIGELYALKFTLSEKKDDYLETILNARISWLQEGKDR